jgi:hypothetical protein
VYTSIENFSASVELMNIFMPNIIDRLYGIFCAAAPNQRSYFRAAEIPA